MVQKVLHKIYKAIVGNVAGQELSNLDPGSREIAADTDGPSVTIEKGQMHSLKSTGFTTELTSRHLLLNYWFPRDPFENFVKESCEDCFTLYFSQLQVAIIDKCYKLSELDKDLNAIIRLAQTDRLVCAPGKSCKKVSYLKTFVVDRPRATTS
jgi:hypothetical protein